MIPTTSPAVARPWLGAPALAFLPPITPNTIPSAPRMTPTPPVQQKNRARIESERDATASPFPRPGSDVGPERAGPVCAAISSYADPLGTIVVSSDAVISDHSTTHGASVINHVALPVRELPGVGAPWSRRGRRPGREDILGVVAVVGAAPVRGRPVGGDVRVGHERAELGAAERQRRCGAGDRRRRRLAGIASAALRGTASRRRAAGDRVGLLFIAVAAPSKGWRSRVVDGFAFVALGGGAGARSWGAYGFLAAAFTLLTLGRSSSRAAAPRPPVRTAWRSGFRLLRLLPPRGRNLACASNTSAPGSDLDAVEVEHPAVCRFPGCSARRVRPPAAKDGHNRLAAATGRAEARSRPSRRQDRTEVPRQVAIAHREACVARAGART